MKREEIKLHSPADIGNFVREIVEGHDPNVTTGAAVLGVTRQALSNLVNRHGGLSPDLAPPIEKAFGVTMDTLLRIQTIWEIAEARKREGEFVIQRCMTVSHSRTQNRPH